MFQIGDQVVYGVHGICRVADEEKRIVDGRLLTYLSLEPVGQAGSKYLVPTHSAAAMAKLRPVLTAARAEELLTMQIPSREAWIADEGKRKQAFRELITSGDCERLLAMVRLLYCHRSAQASAGRKLHMSDENFLRDAERILAGEMAVVLDSTPEQIRQRLRQQLTETVK